MIVDGDLGLDAALFAILGLATGSLVVAVGIGLACARLGREPLGCLSLVMSWMVTVAFGVVVVVLWRTKEHEATVFDWLWATTLATTGAILARRLWRGRPRRLER